MNPPKLTLKGDKRIETFEIMNIGEVDFATGDKRGDISFSSFFPAYYDGGYCQYTDIPDPQDILFKIINIKLAGKPVRLLITESPVNCLVLVTRMDYEIRGGEPGDIYFDFACRTWREVKVQTAADVIAQTSIASTAGTNISSERTDLKPIPKTYKVKKDDSLWAIAKQQLGDSSKWKAIYEANKEVIGSNPDRISIGMNLVMPG